MNQQILLPSYVSARLPLWLLFFACCYFASPGPLLAQITFDWATVGDPGNPPDRLYTANNPDNLRFGQVDYTYRISKYEVTNDQYIPFLNAVDPMGTNPNGIYDNGMSSSRGGIAFDAGAASGAKYSSKTDWGNKPVNYINFFDAMRFVNWLENGQPTVGGGTETGVYTISDGLSETRAPGATFFLPSEDEWYKAAYYDPAANGDAGGYWWYPTTSNLAPTSATANAVGDISNPGTNVANYNSEARWNGHPNVTTVGSAGAGSTSSYGTFDQGGNVVEWNEAVLHGTFNSLRGNRGGVYNGGPGSLRASFRGSSEPTCCGSSSKGFRVASIPEPSTAFLGLLAAIGLLRQRMVTARFA